jgi:hypothetical protein
MKIARIILAGAAAALIVVSSQAWAQQELTGMVTKIDRIHGTVAIERPQSGTVGANAGNTAEELKAQGGVSLDDVHAGDRVTLSVTEAGGTRTITKIQKQ